MFFFSRNFQSSSPRFACSSIIAFLSFVFRKSLYKLLCFSFPAGMACGPVPLAKPASHPALSWDLSLFSYFRTEVKTIGMPKRLARSDHRSFNTNTYTYVRHRWRKKNTLTTFNLPFFHSRFLAHPYSANSRHFSFILLFCSAPHSHVHSLPYFMYHFLLRCAKGPELTLLRT